MKRSKLLVGLTTAALAAGGTAAAVAKTAPAPKHTTINAITSTTFKINRYVQDGTRWQKDVYIVKSGGTITIQNLAASDGPHTFSVVRHRDLPRTTRALNECKICQTIAQELGANPQTQAPPQFNFADNGVGTNTLINIDSVGDTAFIPPQQHAKVTLKVTAKPGTTLDFMCAVHPWMQAKLIVKR